MNDFYENVYKVVQRIPKGKVTTYGVVAFLAGSPRASRVVGSALHHNPSPVVIPCHRVVNRFGKLANEFAFGGQDIQKALLENDGVEVDENFCVDLNKYLWTGEDD